MGPGHCRRFGMIVVTDRVIIEPFIVGAEPACPGRSNCTTCGVWCSTIEGQVSGDR